MGLASGSLTFFRLKFDEKIKITVSEIYKIMEEYSFESIYNEDSLNNYGFVPFGFPENETFNSSEILYDNTYLFSLRFDETKVNKKYFDIEFADKKREFKQETGKEKLSKKDLEFIKNSLMLNMAKRTLPTTTIVEIIFKPETNSLLVSSLSTKIFDALEHLFKASFNITLYKDNLFETAKNVCDETLFIDDLTKTTATEF